LSKLKYLIYLTISITWLLTSPSFISPSSYIPDDYWFEKYHKVKLWMIRNGVVELVDGSIIFYKKEVIEDDK
jgi:hypothetical protein